MERNTANKENVLAALNKMTDYAVQALLSGVLLKNVKRHFINKGLGTDLVEQIVAKATNRINETE